MPYRIIFLEEVDQDITDGINWYKELAPGLDDKFRKDVSEILPLIETNPRLFPEVKAGIRMGLTKRYKFRVVYQLQGNYVIIAAIVHPKRNDAIWKKRIEKDE